MGREQFFGGGSSSVHENDASETLRLNSFHLVLGHFPLNHDYGILREEW